MSFFLIRCSPLLRREREFLRHLEQFYDIQVLKLSEQDPCSNSNSSSQAGVHILLFTKKGDRIES